MRQQHKQQVTAVRNDTGGANLQAASSDRGYFSRNARRSALNLSLSPGTMAMPWEAPS